jgi:hypothetical protein
MIEAQCSPSSGSARRLARFVGGAGAALLGSTALNLALPSTRGEGETEAELAQLT